MSRNSTLKIVFTAMFAALVCVATMLIHIPTPGTGGYVNLGDGVLLAGAFLLPTGLGVAAAGIGSMLADLLAGYMVYAPGTLIVKGLSAFIAAALFRAAFLQKRPALLRRLIAAIVAELFMVAGYLLYESTFLSYGAGALASVPANLVQGAVGVVIALALTAFFSTSHEINELMKKLNG